MNLVQIAESETPPVINDFRGMTLVSSCQPDDVEKFEHMVGATDLNDRETLNEEYLEEKLVNGMYSRLLTIPQGTLLTGKVHKTPYLDIFISGDVTVKSFLHDGTIESSRRLKHFEYLEGVPGRKRVLYAHKETLWLTVDRVEVENVEDAEDAMSVFSLADFNKELPA